MFRNGKVLNKALSGILAAACVVTSMPMGSFAAEVNAGADEAVVIEETAADEVSEDVVEALDADAEVEKEEVFADEAETEVNGAVEAAEEDAVPEDNDGEVDLSKAKVIKIGDNPQSGTASHENMAVYKFVAPVTGRYYINASSEEEPLEIHVFDADKYVTTTGEYYFKKFDKKVTQIENGEIDLVAGKNTYIVIMPWYDASTGINYSGLTISQAFEVTRSLKSEPTEVKFDKEYEGHLCPDFYISKDRGFDPNKNYYQFTLKEPGTFTFHIGDDSTNKKSEYTHYVICNDLDDYLASEDRVNHMSWYWHTNQQNEYGGYTSHNCWLKTDDGSDEARISLLAGNYYIFLYSSLSSGNDKALNYKFMLKDFKALKAAKNETLLVDTKLNGDNDKDDYTSKGYGQYYENSEMPLIETNKAYRGILTEDSRVDYYHFTLAKSGPLFLTLESDDCIGNCYVTLRYWSKEPEKWGTTEVIMKGDTYKATPGQPLDSVQLMNSYYEDSSIIYKKQKPEFMAGEYVIGISTQVSRDESNKVFLGESGQYRFILSTGKVSEKPVTSLKLSQTVIPMAKNDIATFTATVGPKDAPDTSVRFEVDKAGIIEITQKSPAEGEAPVNGETEYEIKALANGQANVKIITNGLDKNKKPIEQTCAVSVIETVLAEPIAVKEKIDLRGAEYFNTNEIAKGDKFDVIAENPKDKVGSVSNGIFTAKKAGKVTIVWNKQVDKKTYVPQKQITIELKMPSFKKNDKGKDIKSSDLIAKRGTVIEPSDWLLDLDKVETIKPDFFECVDKKGVVTLDEDFAANGKLTVEKTGSVKVTAYYGTDKKTAAKMVYTIKSKMPGIKDAKVKPNPVKDKAKDKVVTVSVTNVPNTVKLTAENWKIVKATEDSSGVTLTTETPDSEKIKFTPLEKGNYTKASISIAPGTEAQVLAVIVTIDGVDYQGIVRIQ